MSKLLTEISRIHELMGINKNGYDSLKKMLLNEDTGYGNIMKIYEKLFAKTTQQLDETEQTYLKNFIDEYNKKFPSGKITYTGSLDNLTREALQKTIRNESDDILKELFSGAIRKIQRPDLILGSSNLIKSDTIIQKYLKNRKVDIGGMTNSVSEPTTSLDLLVFINKNGGEIEKTNIPLDSYDIIKSEFEFVINQLGNDNSISKNMSDIVNQIDEYNGLKNVIVDPDIEKGINNIKGSNSVTNNLTNFKNVSEKLKSMVTSDQRMRQGNMDINTDIANQTELKNLMGVDKENFIKDLNTFEDLENLWVIVQHSDNDIEFQKEILKILQNNQQTLETKFSTNSQDIKMGIAMLEDRVMVNTNTSVVGYRDSGMEDFGELINGKQTYGSQGGVNENGEWIPRPIELDGKIYFYESPQRLIDDVEFLNKLNKKRSLMGLGSMEDYLKKMNKTDNFIDDLVDEVIQIEVKGNDKIVHDIFGKNGIYYSKGIALIRDLGDKFLKDYKKLYVEGASKQEIEEYLKGLELLKSKFGDKKIYTTTMEGGRTTKKMTLDEFINDVKNNYKRIYDENGDWSPLNKLDTNYRDNPLELTTFIKTILTKDEYDVFVKKIQDYNKAVKDTPEKLKLENELDKEFENIKLKLNQNEKYVKNWINRVDDITKNIKKNTAVGDFSEKKVNELFEKNGLKVEYTASNGSPIDTQLSIDQIIIDTKNIFGGGVKTVQTKTAAILEEGEFEIINGKRTNNWIPKKGTNTYRCEILMSQKVGKPSQIDLAGFYDPNNGITIITGKQKGLERTVRKDGKRGAVKYDPLDGTPFRSNTMELPGSVLERKWDGSPMGVFIIDAETPKIVG